MPASPAVKLATCEYCEMSFKKLEHKTRHLRIHTLERPFSCTECSKTFARQDTLNRHSRLHTRKNDGTTASVPKPRVKRAPSAKIKSESAEPTDAPASPVSPPLPFSYALPPALPPFPVYSRSELADGGRQMENVAKYDPTTLDSLQLLVAAAGSSGGVLPPSGAYDFFGGGSAAGVESKSSASSSSASVSGDEGSLCSTSVDGPSVDSHYPSPAFTAYSPSSGLNEHMSDLEAILSNDPLHVNNTAETQRRASMADDFVDYERFASSVEGPLSSSAPAESFAQPNSREPESVTRPRSISQPTFVQGFSMNYDYAAIPEGSVDTHPYRPPGPTIRSMTMPSLPLPPTARTSYAVGLTYPSLSIMPNGLGLHSFPPEPTLYEAYSKRRAMSTSFAVPAFYSPNNHILLPPWTGNASGLEYHEPGALFNI